LNIFLLFQIQKRIESNINGFCPCITHSPPTSTNSIPSPDHSQANNILLNGNILMDGNSLSNGNAKQHRRVEKQSKDQLEHLANVFKVYGKFLTLFPVKMVVLVLTSVLLGFSVWGNILLRQEFDPMWFLPKDSYLSLYVEQNDK
jgi:hypothetical protein